MTTPTPTNYSVHSIVAAYGVGLIPHGYYFVKMMANANGMASNILCVFSHLLLTKYPGTRVATWLTPMLSLTYLVLVRTCPISKAKSRTRYGHGSPKRAVHI